MSSKPKPLDAGLLRDCVAMGGLEISRERAEKLLPLADALLQVCRRLEWLELSAQGGDGALGRWGGLGGGVS
jgi:hypothetical protein